MELKTNPRSIKLWLDDVRLPPDDSWVWAKTVKAAKFLLRNHDVVEASLDHDLGISDFKAYTLALKDTEGELYRDPGAGYDPFEPTGYDLVKWMAEHNVWPAQIEIHSYNPAGSMNMKKTIERYHPTIKVCHIVDKGFRCA